MSKKSSSEFTSKKILRKSVIIFDLQLTDGHESPRQLDGPRQIPHLVNGVAEVVQNVCFGHHSFLSVVQLLQGLLKPQDCMVVVCIVVGRLPHVEAVVHCQHGVGVNTYRQVSVYKNHCQAFKKICISIKPPKLRI